MKLGFSKVSRKISKLGQDRRLATSDETFYFFDDFGHIVAKMNANNLLSLIVLGDDGKHYCLNLAYNFKHKCGQDVIKGDIAFLSEFKDDEMPILVKNRSIKYVKDPVLADYEITSCGSVTIKDDVLVVEIPMFSLKDEVYGLTENTVEPTKFWSLVVRTTH